MNDNIENRLNELLKMKDDVDELKSRQKKQETLEDFEKKQKTLKNYYYIWLAVAVLVTLGGLSGLEHNGEKYKLFALFVALVGFNSTILMKLWYFIKESKLSILHELKQLRIQLANQTPSNKE